ncbi:MAG: hypothetical protein HOG69_05045 [Thaumarchaeota archaeon]|jgi:hypothetical protein|nr:hypothetical protein [Nitrososphaerota archaeon]
MTDEKPWSEDQQRYMSTLSQIKLNDLKLLNFSMRDASFVIDQLLGNDSLKTKDEIILELKPQVEDAIKKKIERELKEEKERIRRENTPISNKDPCLTIDD